jgi:outer membrane protein, heavy metal efflux system
MLITALIILGALEEVAPPKVYAGNDELHAYLMEAAEERRELYAQYEVWKAALERHPQVTSLEDPMFTYGQFLQSENNRFRLALTQRFPWFGTLKTRGDQALAAADVELAQLYAARNRIFLEVKQAYYDYAYLHDQVAVMQSQLELYAFTEETVRNQFALGVAREDELRDAQIRYAQQENRLAELEDLRPALSAQLAAAVGRSNAELLPWPQETAPPPEPPPAPVIVARLRVENPALAVYDHRVRSSRYDAELAKKAGYPMITVGLDYTSISKPRQMRPDRPYPASLNTGLRVLRGAAMGPPTDLRQAAIDVYTLSTSNEPMAYSDGGDDNIALTLGFTVPIYRKKVRAGIAEAKHMEQAAAYEQEQLAQTIEAEVRMAVFEYKDAARRLGLYTGTLNPQAAFAYDSLQNAYAAGLLTAVTDVLDAVDTQLEFGLDEQRAERDLRIAAAKIEFFMGQPWSENEVDDGFETEEPQVEKVGLEAPTFEEVDAEDAEAPGE